MSHLGGNYLYHYTSREAAFEYILSERRLRLSSFDLMGDPLEAKGWQFSATYAPGSFSDEKWERAFWESLGLVNQFKRHTKLLALTADAPEGYGGADELRRRFGKGWARARMWERYGEQHRGVCLAFDATRLCERVVDALTEQGAERVLHGEVAYSEAGLTDQMGATTLHLQTVDPADFESVLTRHFDQHGRELFFTKMSEWATEFEYRIAGYTPGSPGFTFVDYGDALAKVYMGDKFPQSRSPGSLRSARPSRSSLGKCGGRTSTHGTTR